MLLTEHKTTDRRCGASSSTMLRPIGSRSTKLLTASSVPRSRVQQPRPYTVAENGHASSRSAFRQGFLRIAFWVKTTAQLCFLQSLEPVMIRRPVSFPLSLSFSRRPPSISPHDDRNHLGASTAFEHGHNSGQPSLTLHECVVSLKGEVELTGEPSNSNGSFRDSSRRGIRLPRQSLVMLQRGHHGRASWASGSRVRQMTLGVALTRTTQLANLTYSCTN